MPTTMGMDTTRAPPSWKASRCFRLPWMIRKAPGTQRVETGQRGVPEQEVGHRGVPEEELVRREVPEEELVWRGVPEEELVRRGFLNKFG